MAFYHSASPARGQPYLRRVQTVWPQASVRSAFSLAENYVVFLSPPAEQVRVVAPYSPLAQPVSVLPRVVGPQISSGVLQWTAREDLPVVLMPPRRIAPR